MVISNLLVIAKARISKELSENSDIINSNSKRPADLPPTEDSLKVKLTKTANGDYSVAVMDQEFQKEAASSQISYNIPTGNSYTVLSNEFTGNNKQHQTSAVQPPANKQKPPPLLLDQNKSRAELTKFSTDTKVQIVSKQRKGGTTIFTHSINDFNTLKKYFAENKISYFTHRTADEQVSKFVLHGLDNLATEIIAENLYKHNLKPKAIKKMVIKNKKYDDHTNFLITFPKTDHITLREVKQVKIIANTIIRWERYTPVQIGPIQCRNCQKFSHASELCTLPPRCNKCAGHHSSNNCPLTPNKEDKLDATKLKCVNCGGKHTSTYSKCTAREKLMRTNIPQSRRSELQRPAPALRDTNDFPPLPPPQKSNYTREPTTSNNNFQWNFTNCNNNNNNNNLFSATECWQIFNSLVSQMRQCKSKEEQIRAIADFTFKFLYP